MAISGAFSAGFLKGFGESMSENIQQRYEQQQKYVDSMMDNARRLAPKYAQDKATADSTIQMMNEFETRYGVSNEEFISLAQNYDIQKVYESIQIAEQEDPSKRLDIRSNIINALKIPEGAKLPDGMSAEDAVRSMVLGYSKNINQTDDVSEPSKNSSWSKAIANVMKFNPRASAEEQIKAMQVAGVPVEELLQYQANAGGTFTPIEGVTRQGVLDFKGDYSESDYNPTVNRFRKIFNTNISLAEDLAMADATTLEQAMKNVGVNNTAELSAVTNKAGTAVADLEMYLSRAGIPALDRNRIMMRIANEVNTGAELKGIVNSVENGQALRLIQESLAANGMVTQEYIEAILSGKSVDKNTIPTPSPNPSPTDADIVEPPVVAPVEEVPETTTQADPEVVTPENTSIVDTIKANTEAAPEMDTNSINIVAGNAATVAQQQENYIKATREAASKITYSEYQEKLETKEGRAELKAMGLPTQKFRTGKDRALAFGVTNPEQYFKPEEGEVQKPTRPEKPQSRTEFVSSTGLDVLNFLMDEMDLDANSSLEEVTDGVAAWFEDNQAMINVGADVTAENVARTMKMALEGMDD